MLRTLVQGSFWESQKVRATHKDKREGGIDGEIKSLRQAVTPSEADSRQERKQECETEFYDGVAALSACDRRDVSVL